MRQVRKMLQTYSNSPYHKKFKKYTKISKKLWKSEQGVQQQQPNYRLQKPSKTTTRVSTITISQGKLICNKVVRQPTTISKFQQEIIPILKGDTQNFRQGNLENSLRKWKNITSDEIVLDMIKNVLKLDLTDTPKSNSKFVFPLSHEEELIIKKKVALRK